jgi:hypothetical protein
MGLRGLLQGQLYLSYLFTSLWAALTLRRNLFKNVVSLVKETCYFSPFLGTVTVDAIFLFA